MSGAVNRLMLLLCGVAAAGCEPAADPQQQGQHSATNTMPVSALPPTRAWQCERSGYVVSSQRRTTGLWLFLPAGTTQLRARNSLGPDNSSQEYSSPEHTAETVMFAGEFEGQPVSFTYADLEARLTGPAGTEDCVENRPLSIREDAKLRGVDFWATGNEPPWKLEISAERILLITGYEQAEHVFPPAAPDSDAANRVARYSSGNGDEQLEVRIEGLDCPDSMSGEQFEAIVTLLLDNTKLTGCGQALH